MAWGRCLAFPVFVAPDCCATKNVCLYIPSAWQCQMKASAEHVSVLHTLLHSDSALRSALSFASVHLHFVSAPCLCHGSFRSAKPAIAPGSGINARASTSCAFQAAGADGLAAFLLGGQSHWQSWIIGDSTVCLQKLGCTFEESGLSMSACAAAQ